MTVKEAIGLLMSPRRLILKGSYSGKIYYNSDNNTLKTRQKYEDCECADKPIESVIKSTDDVAFSFIVIWFRDYELCNKN